MFYFEKNGISVFLLIVVLLVTDIILAYRTVVSHKEIRTKDSIIRSIISSNSAMEYTESNLFYTFEYGGMKMKNIQIKDTTDRAIPLQKVVRKGPALIFRYQQHDCLECIAFGLSQLDKFAESASVRPVILAGYAETYPFKQDSKNMHVENMALYNIENALPLDKLKVPYCFILHPDLHISEVFIPDKSFPKAMKRYTQILKTKYCIAR